MTDLLRVLPDFPVGQYGSLLPALEKHNVTTTDLITLDVADIGKRTQLPLLNLRKFCDAVLAALHKDLGVGPNGQGQKENDNKKATAHHGHPLRQDFNSLASRWQTISTLDPTLDAALNGGIPTGYITEITGESGTGKTQLLLSLLLAVQLPPPHGLGRPALYISTESRLATNRLTQVLRHNPIIQSTPLKPSLDGISSITIQDLESQDHILNFQVPVEVSRRNVGLIVLDSVAANYRAEFERSAAGTFNMGARSADLVRLGSLLRDLARKHNLAVVVANQVADRFGGDKIPSFPSLSTPTPGPSGGGFGRGAGGSGGLGPQDSPLAMRSTQRMAGLPVAEPTSSGPWSSFRDDLTQPPGTATQQQQQVSHPCLTLDHQQRWFTGWGDDPNDRGPQKNPSLGLVWTTQIASRIVLYRKPAYGRSRYRIDDEEGATGMPTLRNWRRWFKVVFAPHVGVRKVEFEIGMGGLKAVDDKDGGKEEEKE